ncbi:uncharacterized protein LOC122114492 isoform X5 [Dipodomys spectabilis]|uniref:uncharacterized protein LOC122114492 isoform X5 n=1 Tax=Dipodomys spectabilis TaxID=105255 RepID=UPI001C543351|nr:uncharacterized protein LOC122114492 isoform X5 [Dipodomys spectabilis]
MFLCCIRRSRDSGLSQEKDGCLSQSCRHWISGKPRSNHLRDLSKKKPRKSQGISGKCANTSALTLNVPCDIWSPEASLLDMLVMNLVPAYQKGDLFYVGNFLHNYRQWATMEQVLDIVFKKYRFPGHNSEEDEQIKNSLCSIFTMWMDCYPADFREPQNRHPVKELTHYAMLCMPSSYLLLHLHILLNELEETGKNETKKQRKKSLCGHLRACFGHHRAVSPDLPRKKPSVMSGMVMDGDLEPSLDSTKSRDSGLSQEKDGCLSQSCRHWISGKPRTNHLRDLSKKKPRKSQGISGKCANTSALTLNVPCNIWSSEASLLDVLVMNLVPAYQKGDLFYVGNFLHNYRQWATMEQVLDIVFKKYRFPGRNSEEDEQIKNLCSIFTMWMDCYPADFREPQNRHPVKELTHYAMLHMPSSDLVLNLHVHLDELEESGKNETKRERKKSLCGHLRACLGRHRAASPDLPRKKPSVMSRMVMDGDLEPSLDYTMHVHVEGLNAFAVRPQKVVSPVDKTVVLKPTCDRAELVGTPKKEEGNSDCLPVTFTGSPDQLKKGQISTPPGVLEGVAHVGLMENVPSQCSGEPMSEVPTLDEAQESESVLTEHLDKSVLLQQNQSPTEKLESASPAFAGANPIFHEELDTLEDSEAEFMFEGNLEADLALELPSPLPGDISLFLFVLIVVKFAFFLFFSIY